MWRTEFNERYEVPKFIEFLVARGIIQDRSWHNDACPTFGLQDAEGRNLEVVLWVDHPLASYRECAPDAMRFMVTIGECGKDSTRTRDTEDLEDALAIFFDYLGEFHKSEGVWLRPEGYLKSLLAEYTLSPDPKVEWEEQVWEYLGEVPTPHGACNGCENEETAREILYRYKGKTHEARWCASCLMDVTAEQKRGKP
jgi:hypothetical protein